MADDGYVVSSEDFERLSRTVEYVESIVESPSKRRHVNYPSTASAIGVIGLALTAITPAPDNLTGTSFDFVKIVVDPDAAASVPKKRKLELDDEGEPKVTKGVNHSTKLSANVNAFVKCQRIDGGELEVYSAEDECEDAE